MKVFAFFLISTSLAGASVPSLPGMNKQNQLDDYDKKNEADFHRILRSKSRCKDDFVCPDHSVRKPGRECYDTFDDCECDAGYRKNGGTCVAERGICTEEYAEMVMKQVEEAEAWANKIYQSNKENEIYWYYQNAEVGISDAWKNYNRGKASCEVEFGDDFFDDEDSDRRLLRGDRQLFFKKIARAFKKVAKAVVTVVKTVVKAVVDVVVEVVECGVGIVNDGLKCGLIGCAFGLVGVGLDIAFAAATGGLSKAVEASCSLSEALSDNDDEDEKKKKKASVLGPVLHGIGDAVCTINTKFDNPTLATVCDAKEEADRIDNGLALVDLLVRNDVVFRFLEAFRVAMCGNPGSAVTDLLEEVVSCSIGCAEENNVFCPAVEEEAEADEEDGRDETQVTPAVITFNEVVGNACRTANGGKGERGVDFDLFTNKSESECEALCAPDVACRAFEYSNGRCELWSTKPTRFEEIDGFACFVKNSN